MSNEDFKTLGMVNGRNKAVDINWSHNDGIDARITLFVKDSEIDQMNYILV